MKTLLNISLMLVVSLFMTGCFAAKTYMGKVDVVGIGAGAKASSSDSNYVNKSKLPNVEVTYAKNITVEEQKVSDTVKYVAGDALTRKFSGEPKLLVNYLNAYQGINRVLILDKDGVVAWSGILKNRDVSSAQGVYDYGFTGIDRMSFGEAMEKFVLDQDSAADYDTDKKLDFKEKGSMFSNAGKYPFLFTKLPNITVTNSDGKEVSLSSLTNNKKPTVLVFYMSKARGGGNDLLDDVGKVANVVSMFGGNSSGGGKPGFPQDILQGIEESYFSK